MNDIYKEQLMEHFKNPQNKGVIKDPSSKILKRNPLCGDTISMQIKLDKNVIKDIKFNSSACAVTVAAASILTEEVIGKDINYAKSITKDKLLDLLGVELTTSRVKCALLALESLQGMLEGIDDKD